MAYSVQMVRAEEFKRQLESEYEAKQNGSREVVDVAPEKIIAKDAVSRFISSKRNENLAESTLDKLKTIFEKQFLSWATESRLRDLEEITTADLEAFRDTWEDGPLATKKKQERLIGFFYYCVRLGWIKANPAVSLGRIRADGPPETFCLSSRREVRL
jgi:integrase/recombinase XerD